MRWIGRLFQNRATEKATLVLNKSERERERERGALMLQFQLQVIHVVLFVLDADEE